MTGGVLSPQFSPTRYQYVIHRRGEALGLITSASVSAVAPLVQCWTSESPEAGWQPNDVLPSQAQNGVWHFPLPHEPVHPLVCQVSGTVQKPATNLYTLLIVSNELGGAPSTLPPPAASRFVLSPPRPLVVPPPPSGASLPPLPPLPDVEVDAGGAVENASDDASTIGHMEDGGIGTVDSNGASMVLKLLLPAGLIVCGGVGYSRWAQLERARSRRFLQSSVLGGLGLAEEASTGFAAGYSAI